MLAEVRVVSGARSAQMRAAPARYRLRFPRHWRAQPVSNPAEAAIEEGTLAWLATHGMGIEAADREKLRKFECGKYGGYSMPRAALPEALLITEYISLWLFWDDVEVEEHAGWSVDDVVRVLTTRGPPSESRYVNAWGELGARLGERRGAGWLTRLGLSMREWLENARRETGLARVLRETGKWPAPDELFACRTVSIGMYPTFYLIELAEGVELPDAFHDHPVVKVLKQIASRLVGAGNDLGGLAKDIRHGWLNVVLALADAERIGVEEAFGRVVDLHNREVLDFDRTARELPSFGPEVDPLVQRWLDGVRYSVYGFALWESLAERYQEHTALTGGRVLLAPIEDIDVPGALAEAALSG